MKPPICRTVVIGLLLVLGTAMQAAPAPDPEKFREVAFFRGIGMITDLTFSPDSKLLAVSSYNREGVRLWDVESGKIARVLPHREAGRAQFSPDGKIIATAGKHIKLWDTASGKELATFKQVSSRWLSFSPDGKMLAAVYTNYVTVLNIDKKEEVRCYDIAKSRYAIVGYPAQKMPEFVLDPGKDKPLALIDPFTGKEVIRCQKHLQNADQFAVDGKGKLLAGYCWEMGARFRSHCSVCLWDREKGKLLGSWEPAVEGSWRSLALSPDGNLLVLYDEVLVPDRLKCGLRFYVAQSGRLLHYHQIFGIGCTRLGIDTLRGLVFSPNGRFLAAAEGMHVQIWNIPKTWRTKE